jgi:RNA polymerase sigma factor (sigma-70 family)
MAETRLVENRYATIEEAIEKDGYALSHATAKKYYRMARNRGCKVELADVHQACMLAVWKTRGSYDAAKSKHTTWIVWAAWSGASEWFRNELKHLHEHTFASEDRTIADLQSVYSEPEPKEKIFGEFDRYLRPHERRMLTLYYVDDLPLWQLNTKVCKERNRQLMNRIKKDVKRRMELARGMRV